MYYKIIDPIEVFKSNVANSLVKLKYPFLSTTIVSRASGGYKDDRGAGWAYHYFVEGYNAMGLLGIFYNALFWNIGMILWFKLAQSNNEKTQQSYLSISALVIILVMRSNFCIYSILLVDSNFWVSVITFSE